MYTIYVSISHKDKWNHIISRKMDGTGDHHVEQDKLSSKTQKNSPNTVWERGEKWGELN
jgi:hypothetical protein